MLVSFSGENIRSFRDPFTVSMLATALASTTVRRSVPWREGDGPSSFIEVLPVAAFFGANASGKTNVIRALDDMRGIVLNSFKRWAGDAGTVRRPFLLDDDSVDRPSTFEVEVVLGGVLHRYGFSMDNQEILAEWAFRFPNGRAQRVFERSGASFKFPSPSDPALRAASKIVRNNALLLSTVVGMKESVLTPLYNWFRRNLLSANDENRSGRQAFTAKGVQDKEKQSRILQLLRAADLGIASVDEVNVPLSPEMEEKMEKIVSILLEGEDDSKTLRFDEPKFFTLVHEGADGKQVAFDPQDESLGTSIWFALAGPILDALDRGSVLLADELDSSLHPSLVAQLVGLFQSPESNPNRAQLIFNTHDGNLLGLDNERQQLGRDQIWFTEKAPDGSSSLHALADLAPRKNESVRRRYFAGLYGGLPMLSEGDFHAAVRKSTSEAMGSEEFAK